MVLNHHIVGLWGGVGWVFRIDNLFFRYNGFGHAVPLLSPILSYDLQIMYPFQPFSYDDRNQYRNDDDYDYRNRNRNPYDRDRNRYVSDVDNPDLYQNRQPYNPNQGDRFRNPDGRYNPNQRPYVSDVDNPDLYQDRNPPPYSRNPNDDRFDPNRRPQFGPPNERDFERGRPRDSFFQGPFRSPEEERRFRAETEKLRSFLTEIDRKSSLECSLNVGAQWNFETNVNEATQVEAVSFTCV